MPNIQQWRNKLDGALRFVSRLGISIYQHTLSPDKGIPSLRLKGRVCVHEPHCSEYAQQVLRRYNFFSSWTKIMERISGCMASTAKKYDPSHYRVIFMSGSPIGVTFLQGLYDDPHFEVTGVVTMPDVETGRGRKIKPNIIKQESLALGIDPHNIKTPKSLRLQSKKYGAQAQETYEWIKEQKPDFIVVIAYGNIVPQHILDIPHFGPINVHGSLLPEYRGASPLQSVFLDNRDYTGLTIMKMFATLDTGDMIDKWKIPLPFSRTVKNLITTITQKGPAFLNKTLRSYAMGHLIDKPQDEALATHCHKIHKEEGKIQPNIDTIQSIYNKYRAYALWPKIHFSASEQRSCKGKTIIIDKLILDETIYNQQGEQPLFGQNNQLHPAVIELHVKPEGKKTMTREAFVNGYAI